MSKAFKSMPAAGLRGFFGLVFLIILLGWAPLSAQVSAPFKPSPGQSGKDVVWMPTPDGLVKRMLNLAQVKPDDYVVDLGAGDGKIVIAAARDFKARALGLEFDANMVAHARSNAKEAGVSDRAKFQQADIFASDFSDADVVTMYLLPNLNLRLRDTLLAMKPGTRVVSHQFTMGDWEADETSWVEHSTAYLWIVPANAAGTWRLSYPQGGSTVEADLTIEQVFQKVQGTLEFPGMRTKLRVAHVDGPKILFSFTDTSGAVLQFSGTITAARIQGTVSGPDGNTTFTAERRGQVPRAGG